MWLLWLTVLFLYVTIRKTTEGSVKKEVREIFRCEHCGKVYLIERYCVPHEDVCKKNPLNTHPCFDCKHCEGSDEQVGCDYHPYMGEYDTKEIVPWFCSKLKQHMLTRRMAIRVKRKHRFSDFLAEYDEKRELCVERKVMPRVCSEYEKSEFVTSWIPHEMSEV